MPESRRCLLCGTNTTTEFLQACLADGTWSKRCANTFCQTPDTRWAVPGIDAKPVPSIADWAVDHSDYVVGLTKNNPELAQSIAAAIAASAVKGG